jgi:drug/metabolite transporter (DMT)-like permease
MAEIRVEPKRTSRAWIWVLLLLLVVAGAAYYLWSTGMLGTGARGTGAGDTVRPVGSLVFPLMARSAPGGRHGA